MTVRCLNEKHPCKQGPCEYCVDLDHRAKCSGTCPNCRADREREVEESIERVSVEAEGVEARPVDPKHPWPALQAATAREQAKEFGKTPLTGPLMEAHELVHGRRQGAYGAPGENFARIAGLWNAQFGIELNARDVAVAMMLVKAARLAATPGHRDSLVDIAGYAEAYWLAD